MSNSTATRQRPLSPHLFIYKPIPTMVMSIVHRMTGAALYFGTLLVAWWLIAASISQEYFDLVSAVYGSWIGRLVLFCYTWALVHHMIGGIRHLVWDTGTGLEKETATKMAWVTVVASVVLTILIWIVGYMTRGA
jgi:succinate dehydrogenase / fumarate reductase cytochrome b subunit